MRRSRLAALTLAALFGAVSPALGQTAQKISIQGSGLSVRLTGVDSDELGFGEGGELQIRYTPSAFSIGVGVQSTMHTIGQFDFTYNGFFVEPRYVVGIGSDRVAPYLSARIMSLSGTAEFAGVEIGENEGAAVAAGGGLLIALGSRVNIDLGITTGKEFYDGEAAAGATVVTRLGLAVGLF